MVDETSTPEAGDGATPSPDANTSDSGAAASPVADANGPAPKPGKKKSLGSKILDQMKVPQGLPGQDKNKDEKKQHRDPMQELVDDYQKFVEKGLYQGIDGAKEMASDIKNLFSKGGKGGDSPAADSVGKDGEKTDAAATADAADEGLVDSATQEKGSEPAVAMTAGPNPKDAGKKLDDVMDDFGESWQKLEEACSSPSSSSSPTPEPGKDLEADVTSAPTPGMGGN